MGDGRKTIRELVEIENRDPRRAEHHASSLSKIHIDEIAVNILKDQGFARTRFLRPGSLCSSAAMPI